MRGEAAGASPWRRGAVRGRLSVSCSMSAVGHLRRSSRLLFACFFLSQGACYSWRPMMPAPRGDGLERRPPAVRVTMDDGTVSTLRSPVLSTDSILGHTPSGVEKVDARRVRLVEERRFNAVRTAGLVVVHATLVVGFIAWVISVQPHYYW